MLTRLYKENLLLQQRLFGTRRIFRSIPSAPPWYSTVEHVTQATPLLAKQIRQRDQERIRVDLALAVGAGRSYKLWQPLGFIVLLELLGHAVDHKGLEGLGLVGRDGRHVFWYSGGHRCERAVWRLACRRERVQESNVWNLNETSAALLRWVSTLSTNNCAAGMYTQNQRCDYTLARPC